MIFVIKKVTSNWQTKLFYWPKLNKPANVDFLLKIEPAIEAPLSESTIFQTFKFEADEENCLLYKDEFVFKMIWLKFYVPSFNLQMTFLCTVLCCLK